MMKNGMLVRIVGAILLVIALVNYYGLFSPEIRKALISLPAVFARSSLMLASGLGLVLLRKWGVYTVGAMIVVNWLSFFIIYGGNSGPNPIWYSLLGPILFAMLFYFSWSSLK
ncbi:MAG: hypothetical protein KZQ91_12280 [Candidatus Thiodiazotropha sp. (ex Lucinoma borealis)]|nr:hypothetical protein [Candidatus Thiodiazotropha sp. (ex Lucinoma borealis)]